MLLLLASVLTLTPNLSQFTERFNAYSDRYRIVILASPT